MTIKELKEQIERNPSKLNKREREAIAGNALNLFNEDLKVEQIIQNKFVFVSMLKKPLQKIQ